MPDGHFKALEARFLQRRQILQRGGGQALGRGHGVGLDLLAFDLLRGVGGLVAQQIHLVAHQVGNRGGSTLVGHRRHFGLQLALEQQAAQVRC
ncbi:hypothetical protein SDC9_206915 [bioreactor metagenome]|uniref:Uncharacterized protein n=1 Tax=bioreactor metagenome TaxID=1076179 RepID=A0A645J641_9ZZZZ